MPDGGLLTAGALGAGGSIISGLLGSNAASSASKQQAQVQQEALQMAQQDFQFGQTLLNPFVTAGTGALNQLSDIYGIPYNNTAGTSFGGGPQAQVAQTALANFTNTPDYQFAYKQGQQATERAGAAGGDIGAGNAGVNGASGGLSGGILKGLTEFGQGLATQQFSNYWNRLASLAGIGLSGAGGAATAAGNQANTTSSLLGSIGSTLAAGTLGSANSLVGGLGGATGSISQALLLSRLSAASPSGYLSGGGQADNSFLGTGTGNFV
jgi:hypothetical protein